MKYPALVIANEFIDLGLTSNNLVDPMKLQKLVYLTHGWRLAFKNEPLISEKIEAWEYGPVVPVLYSRFKQFRSREIDETAAVLPGSPAIDGSVASLIRQVWKKYQNQSAIQLSMLTHEAGYAWDTVRKRHERDGSGLLIPDYLIKDEFCRRLELPTSPLTQHAN